MGKIPDAAQARFDQLVDQLGNDDGTTGPRRKGFGSHSMFVGRKMFALLGSDGALVVKLPPVRVAELIATGVGAPWHPGTGSPLKEYVAVGFDQQRKWPALAKEARAFMASKS
jgi:hypothetical protein